MYPQKYGIDRQKYCAFCFVLCQALNRQCFILEQNSLKPLIDFKYIGMMLLSFKASQNGVKMIKNLVFEFGDSLIGKLHVEVQIGQSSWILNTIVRNEVGLKAVSRDCKLLPAKIGLSGLGGILLVVDNTQVFVSCENDLTIALAKELGYFN